MQKDKKKKKSKKTKPIGRFEFIFNIISLLAVIGIGIYFGVRSFYYYNVENNRVVEGNKTLNGSIINNNKVTDGDGLHHDTDGYYFKGKVLNNYVKFANRLFRVIRVNENGSVKVISEDVVSSFMWGEDSNYANSNLKSWLSTDATLGVFYKTLPNINNYLVKTVYSEDRLNGNKVISNKSTDKDFLTTLTIADYSNANGKDSFLNTNKAFWILGQDNDTNNLYIDVDGSIESALGYESYGIRVVFSFKKDISISSGSGTVEDPYIITQEESNYVDNYVKLGSDIWKVNYDDGTTLKMYLNKSVGVKASYGTGSLYDYNDYGSLANYLNFNYLATLPYNNVVLDNNFFTGEMSEEYYFDYKNVYSSFITCKVGMLNMFDYYTGDVDDFFLMNTTSSVGDMVYIHRNNGMLEEVTASEERDFVPVIAINKSLIKGGSGTQEEPFIVG